MYHVRRVHIGKTAQLDELAHECGILYSKTLVFFWRTVRHKGLWLKPKHLMRLFTSKKLHAHTADACVQSFFASLKSWRERRATDPTAHPPRRRKWYFRIEYKRSAMALTDGMLRLSNGRGNEPLVLNWPWELPVTVVIHWTGTQYEAIATYEQQRAYGPFPVGKVAGIDLGEVHMAVSHDGERTYILNGRLLRSKRQYQNKLKARLQARIDVKNKGSRRRKQLTAAKSRQLRKLTNQIKDIEHKQTTRLITTLHEQGVQTVVIGTNNQKIHQWSHGSIRFKLTYKAERLGMDVALQDEHYTSRTCSACGYVRSKVKGRMFRCPQCGWTYHRDGVGAMNIRQKYRGELGSRHVVGAMAPPTSLRYYPQSGVARTLGRENVCVGNCAEAAPL